MDRVFGERRISRLLVLRERDGLVHERSCTRVVSSAKCLSRSLMQREDPRERRTRNATCQLDQPKYERCQDPHERFPELR